QAAPDLLVPARGRRRRLPGGGAPARRIGAVLLDHLVPAGSRLSRPRVRAPRLAPSPAFVNTFQQELTMTPTIEQHYLPQLSDARVRLAAFGEGPLLAPELSPEQLLRFLIQFSALGVR